MESLEDHLMNNANDRSKSGDSDCKGDKGPGEAESKDPSVAKEARKKSLLSSECYRRKRSSLDSSSSDNDGPTVSFVTRTAESTKNRQKSDLARLSESQRLGTYPPPPGSTGLSPKLHIQHS